MGKRIYLCRLSDLPDSEAIRIDLEDRELLVLKLKGKVFVADTWCTHQRSDLTLGVLNEEQLTITCALHQAKFRLVDGEVVEGPSGAPPSSIPRLKTYEAVIEGDSIYVEV